MAKRILLVDDEPQLLFSVKEFLHRVGYDVVPAESGAQALEELIEGPPDVIISDILMEEMDGFEFQRRVNALTGNSIPFIFLTAKGDLRDRLDGLRGGADDYVVKPFEPEELEARIAAVLNRVEQIHREDQRDIENLRGRILAEISRQLRTPATSIMAHLNLLLSERCGPDQSKQERYLRNAVDDANVLNTLIRDLSWANPDICEEAPLRREPVRVAPIVRGAAANAARLASEKSIDLQISCGGLLSANIDATAMSRALAALLDAAVEFSAPHTTVRIAAMRAHEGGLEFVITDGCSAKGPRDAEGTDMPSEALELTRRVVTGHSGRFAIRKDEDGRHSITLWLPGRMPKHIGRRQ
jgi:DNA-binding response OmpR family regulator